MAALLSAVALVASVCVGQDAATAARLPLAPPRAVDAVELAAALGAAAGVRGDARGGRVGVTRAETADGAREFWVAAPLDGGGRRVHGATVGGMVWASGRLRRSSSPALLAAVLAEVDSAVVVDVGAHCGYFSLLAATGGARAVALEPNAEHHPLLRLGAAPTAVGAARRVRCDDAAEAAEAGWGAPVRPIAWLKVDVEGQELAALRSAARLLDRPPGLRPGVVWVELSWLDGDAASLGAAAATVALLVRRGYDARARARAASPGTARRARDCGDPRRDAHGEGWLDVVDIERGYEAEGARRLLEAAGYCDRRGASTARGGCQLEVAAVAADAPCPASALRDASCDATLAELREKRRAAAARGRRVVTPIANRHL
ncbi:hypothetical protein SO694_00002887 [Aureococcus anophagefferens]|uniref:Methyltransferase FkbM domain-containing protein n=1 Tax=Aureococcus anophagefferens TaxID=44056 RepID=A0ABR1GCY0_AURAN